MPKKAIAEDSNVHHVYQTKLTLHAEIYILCKDVKDNIADSNF